MPCRWYPSMPCSRSPGGIPACLAAGLQGGIPACLAGGACSHREGVHALGGACSRGVLALGDACSRGGMVEIPLPADSYCCILLECILVTGHNEVVAKVMFLQVCVCPQGGRVSASVHAGMPYPPGWRPPQMENPPGWRTPLGWRIPPRWRTPPLDGEHPPGMENPPWMENPPGWRTPRMENPPPGKQTTAYCLRAAGTHPTGMHSCSLIFFAPLSLGVNRISGFVYTYHQCHHFCGRHL